MIRVDLMVGEGDYVACHYTMQATHQGEFLGVPPTGKAVDPGDVLGLLQQLGVAPAGSA